MAKVGNASEGAGLEQSTPKDAAQDSEFDGPKDGIHLTRPRTTIVDEYPERPYSEAITEQQRALLAEHGQEPV